MILISEYSIHDSLYCVSVIDVYQTWCGICTGMTSNFRKYRNDTGDQLLRFYAVSDPKGQQFSLQKNSLCLKCVVLILSYVDIVSCEPVVQ